jgi:hypothetical protein
VRTALFKPASALVGFLLQAAAQRIDSTYQPKPGQHRKGRESLQVQSIFGGFELQRDDDYHEGKKHGYYPADAGLGLESGNTPAWARLLCLEGAEEASYQKAERHFKETGGIQGSACQIQRRVQAVGKAAQTWQEREAQKPEPGRKAVAIMYGSGDGSGAPMRKTQWQGGAGKQADGTSKTRPASLDCVFTRHRTDEENHPLRDYESTS